ncbi:hypothetical protein J5N97_003752 [Dioscorea zingiberensis]|uniref:Uncharacterized protein n=1 Tax=Dioscorea zingiberensis TaxID=325984 RepID=A0A9D5HQW4_9LILI|nr:hypothetical protein J5N97_003752 [Dioscorea zingiberensis]
MAYRRKQAAPRTATFEDFRSSSSPEDSSPPSIAAQAIRASAAHRDSSLSSAYAESAIASAYGRRSSTSPPREATAYEYTSMKNLNESKYGFWGVLARKAKSILDDDNAAQRFESHGRNQTQMPDTAMGGKLHQPDVSSENIRKKENPTMHKSSEAIASSLNYIGGTIKNAFEEGLTIVENRTADIIQETRKLQIRRKGSGSGTQNLAADLPQMQADHETQLKVANAMAAKAKLLLRELKTVKADLAFAKERCAQLEEENKILRESRDKGDNPEDDDLIRLQLETLLAEKARLAHENSIYARENRFLREIVEYHQLTMQDVVYVDEGIEEVTEVYPVHNTSSLSRSSSGVPSPAVPNPNPAPPPPAPLQSTVIAPEACPIVPIPPALPPLLVKETQPAGTKAIVTPLPLSPTSPPA